MASPQNDDVNEHQSAGRRLRFDFFHTRLYRLHERPTSREAPSNGSRKDVEQQKNELAARQKRHAAPKSALTADVCDHIDKLKARKRVSIERRLLLNLRRTLRIRSKSRNKVAPKKRFGNSARAFFVRYIKNFDHRRVVSANKSSKSEYSLAAATCSVWRKLRPLNCTSRAAA